jgi:predicted kinase
MKQKKVIILRSASGAGKSTIAKLFVGNLVICTADDFFYDRDGNYNFDPNLLSIAHEQCFRKFHDALENQSVDTIVVANTNTKISEFQKYIDEAEKYDNMVFSLVVEKRHNETNSHGTPESVIDRHVENIKNSLKLK